VKDRADFEFILYKKYLASIVTWFTFVGLVDKYLVFGYENYGVPPHDFVMNFVDAGNISYVGPTALKYRASRNLFFH